MSIRVVCPNGHLLRVNDGCAGKTGLCPVCRGLVKVPEPTVHEALSEDTIAEFFSPSSTTQPLPSVPRSGATATKPKTDPPVPVEKPCERCHKQIPAETHICPNCHTYVGGVSLF
jgi:hypothetical protein